jgi:hypothetical protein
MPVQHDAKRPQPLYKLSAEEIADPQLVIEELFDFAHLPEIRLILWDWLKATVTGSYPEDLSKEERNAILILYEKIEKLVEAAHVLREPGKKKKNN